MKRVGGGETYTPRSSGLLRGAGFRRFRRRKSAIMGWGKNFPDQMLSNGRVIREEVPDFDPALEFAYTRRELMLIAEKIILCDEKSLDQAPVVLNASMYRHRLRAEIYTESGTPDPAISEGLYWRTHPLGRPFAAEEMRRTTGCGFYDGAQTTDREIVEPEPIPQAPFVRKLCDFPGCGADAGGRQAYCPGHRSQLHQGAELTPIHRVPKAQLDAVRQTWDSGETTAAVARRFGISEGYAGRLRLQGRGDATSEILRAGA